MSPLKNKGPIYQRGLPRPTDRFGKRYSGPRKMRIARGKSTRAMTHCNRNNMTRACTHRS
ncbi:hypothetical protein C7S16_4730 [Burkholderia thailandensis]|uniref:Uncharacterized protein n=1 Tax=Burkholderia thailandensis TaxID=57975 RepID=A0AAW9CQE0_BURTH|nr:hypothetical protein [Burkholderia thailandensis]MDW9251323.1 hypothetical protein [Burkholderia thailandensis]